MKTSAGQSDKIMYSSRFEDIIYSKKPQEILLQQGISSSELEERIFRVKTLDDTRITFAKIVRHYRDKSPKDTPLEAATVARGIIMGYLASKMKVMTEDRADRIRGWFEEAKQDFDRQFP